MRIDQLEVYARPLADVEASAAGAEGGAPTAGSGVGTSSTPLTVASLLPGHCIAQPAGVSAAEASLREVLLTAFAAHGVLQLESVAQGTLPGTGGGAQHYDDDSALRVLAPLVAVAAQWIPDSSTTRAAWQLLGAQQAPGSVSPATARSVSDTIPEGRSVGGPGIEGSLGNGEADAAIRSVEEGGSAGSTLVEHRAYDARILCHATEALRACQLQSSSAGKGPGGALPDSEMQEFFTALAQVRTSCPCVPTHHLLLVSMPV